MQWNGNTYVDAKLQFGLRSAPKIFNAVADALEWCIASKCVEVIYNYLDDFAILGAPESNNAVRTLAYSREFAVSWVYLWLLRSRQAQVQL